MASWNIKSHVSKGGRKELKEVQEVKGLLASLPLRYRQHHAMYTWGSEQEHKNIEDNWKLDPPQQELGLMENKQKRSHEKLKKKRRFVKGSTANVNDNEDVVPRKNDNRAAKFLNQISPSARGEYHNLGKYVSQANYDYSDGLESHKYLFQFLEFHNNNSQTRNLFKSLSDPELNRSPDSRYIFPVEGRHYDVEKMTRYIQEKKRSLDRFPLGPVSPPQPLPVIQQERELETCEIVPEQFLLY